MDDDTIEHARRLFGAGLITIPTCRPTGPPTGATHAPCSARWHAQPCDRAGKRPLVPGYPGWAAGRPSLAEVERQIRGARRCNIAIVTGLGLVVLEADSPAGEAEFAALGGSDLALAPAREARPGRGRGYLFRPPDGLDVANGAGRGASQAIDVRGTGGLLVAPPSSHVTGHVYAWAPGRAPWELTAPPVPADLRPLLVSASRTTVAKRRTAMLDESPPHAAVSPRVAFVLASYPDMARLWHGEGKRTGDTSASGYDYAIARELLAHGVPQQDVCAALQARPRAHRRDAAYAGLTVTRASARGRT